MQDLPRERSTTRRRFGATALLTLPLVAGGLLACGGGAEAKEDGAPEGAAGGPAKAAEVLWFSAIPDDNKAELAERFGLIAAHLSKELGVQVAYKPSASYEASVEAFKNGDVQLAWFGGVSGVKARAAVDGARAIAQGKVDPEYVSYFIAHKDTGIEPGDEFPDMEGRTFTFGPRGSTSGRLMPTYFLQKFTGKTADEYFSSHDFSTGHDNTAERVASGAFECGALSYKTYDALVRDGKLDPEVCVKVWTTPTYADYNWTAHPLLEERYGAGFTDKLQAALVGITDPDLLRALERDEGIIPAANEDFEGIRETMVALDMFR